MKPANIFQSGMLLQRGIPVNVWGTGASGEKIRAEIQGKQAETTADTEGNWSLSIPSLRESFGETMILQGEKETMKLKDLAVGEVFVAAGQSNMEFWMRYEKHYSEIVLSCENPNIRFYDMPKLSYVGQEQDFDYHNVGVWRKASRENLEYFSAVGYFFARKLEKELSVPVGIIGCNWGGTCSLAWMKETHARRIQKEQTAAFEQKLNGQSYAEFCQNAGKNPANDTGNSTWNLFNDFILPGTPSADEIAEFLENDENSDQTAVQANPKDAPGALYRHMVQRLAPYTIRAVLWYQGESDDAIDGTQKNYKAALDAVKKDWRDAWNRADLPFFVVQLPGFRCWFGIDAKGFPTIRECQQKSVDEDGNAYLCSISDAGEEFDIHPKDKMVVGERLALLAEKYLFGKDILADAPRMQDVRREGSRILISFENAEGGLVLEGNQIHALAVTDGEDAIPYTAWISGGELVIELKNVAEGSVKVKFARDMWYRVNLYNQAQIPAIPFDVSC